MEKLEMIQVDENGQLFVDWDSLESITNEDFVNKVKFWYEENVKVRDFKIYFSTPISADSSYQIYMKAHGVISIFQFYRGSIDVIHVPDFELKEIL